MIYKHPMTSSTMTCQLYIVSNPMDDPCHIHQEISVIFQDFQAATISSLITNHKSTYS